MSPWMAFLSPLQILTPQTILILGPCEWSASRMVRPWEINRLIRSMWLLICECGFFLPFRFHRIIFRFHRIIIRFQCMKNAKEKSPRKSNSSWPRWKSRDARAWRSILRTMIWSWKVNVKISVFLIDSWIEKWNILMEKKVQLLHNPRNFIKGIFYVRYILCKIL